jgi:PBP1b-binding outer membrane lipoprotein LpoB
MTISAWLLTGCGPKEPPPTIVDPSTPERGVELDSKDVVTMAHQMAASIAACPHVAKNEKQPVTVVMAGVKNQTRTIDYLSRMSLAKIRVELNRQLPRGKVLFVMERGEQGALERAERGVPLGSSPGARRVRPDYVLKGRFLDHPSRRGVYYLCTFQLAHLESGVIVWEDSYEVKRAR